MSFPKRSREAAWFIGSEVDESSEKELAALKVEIASLRALVERQQNR